MVRVPVKKRETEKPFFWVEGILCSRTAIWSSGGMREAHEMLQLIAQKAFDTLRLVRAQWWDPRRGRWRTDWGEELYGNDPVRRRSG